MSITKNGDHKHYKKKWRSTCSCGHYNQQFVAKFSGAMVNISSCFNVGDLLPHTNL
jgi:hypothetical protein